MSHQPPRRPWPDDAAREAAIVAVLVCEIRLSDDIDRDILVEELLSAAWPTRRAQYQ